MTPLVLLLLAGSPPLERVAVTHDLAALTSAQANELLGRRARFKVAIDPETDPDEDNGVTVIDAVAPEGYHGSVWFRRGGPSVEKGVVLATLRVIRHADAPDSPAFTEYRLVDADGAEH